MFQMIANYRNWWLGPGIMDMFWNYKPFIVDLFDAVSDFNCIYSPCGSSGKTTLLEINSKAFNSYFYLVIFTLCILLLDAVLQ